MPITHYEPWRGRPNIEKVSQEVKMRLKPTPPNRVLVTEADFRALYDDAEDPEEPKPIAGREVVFDFKKPTQVRVPVQVGPGALEGGFLLEWD